MSFNLTEFLHSGALISLSDQRILLGWGHEYSATGLDELDPQQPAFYLNDFFFTDSKPWRQFSHWREMSLVELDGFLMSSSGPGSNEWTILQPDYFQRAFETLQVKLEREELLKAVPYVFAESLTSMTTLRLQWSLKKALMTLKRSAGYLYGCWTQTSGVLGITPEMLFVHSSREPQRISTMALAGTCPSSTSVEDFLKNSKERREHHFVVQGICQSLQELGSVQVEVIQVLKLPSLLHLLTPIHLTLHHPFDFEALVRSLHPTPALGAFPKEEGKRWLLDFQGDVPRHYYGAPIGLYAPFLGKSHCLVGIRNVQWDTQGMRIGAGCGVVKESVFEREWAEIQLKLKVIQDQLGL